MALTIEQAIAYWNKHQDVRALIAFVSAEVRKEDEALIRQMRNALYALPLPYTSETRAALQAGNEWLDAAIAERTRLEKAP